MTFEDAGGEHDIDDAAAMPPVVTVDALAASISPHSSDEYGVSDTDLPDAELAGTSEAGANPFHANLYEPVLRSVALLSRADEERLGQAIHDSRVEMTVALAAIPAAAVVFVDYMRQADAKERPITDALFAPLEDYAGLDGGVSQAFSPDSGDDANTLNWRQAARLARQLLDKWNAMGPTEPGAGVLCDLRQQLTDTVCRLEPGFIALGEALRHCQALDGRVSTLESELDTFHGDILSRAPRHRETIRGGERRSEAQWPIAAAAPIRWWRAREALLRVQDEAGVDLTTLRAACEAAAAAHARYRIAREHMITANLRLAHYMAHRLQGQGLSREDLVQEAVLGLMRAVDKFDYRLGYKFSTYAVRWIRQSMGRAIADASRTIRVAAHMHDEIVRVRKHARTLEQRLERKATPAELAEATGLSESKVREAMRLANMSLSLDTPVPVFEGESLQSVIADTSVESPSDTAHDTHLTRTVAELLGELPTREAFIIRLRHGIGGMDPQTLDEVGQRLGITRERTRQLEQRAFERLRAVADPSLMDGLEH